MKARLTFSPQAERDLAEIEAWLVREASPKAAASVLERIVARLELVTELPFSGVPRPEFGPETRFVRTSSYVIYYDARETEVDVLRVLHKAQDRDAIMRRQLRTERDPKS